MDKSLFERNFNELLDKNFEKFSKYFDYELKVFFELRTSIFQINKCLILELDKAAITLTNNLLEQLLKLALTNDEVGLGSIPVEEWDAVFGETERKYGSLPLANSIEQCKKRNIITQAEKDYLFNTVRELMRNGFSHADSSKILESVPDKLTGFMASFSGPLELKQVQFNQKVFPALKAFLIDDFAKKNAAKYFEFVFELILRIEKRLIAKDK